MLREPVPFFGAGWTVLVAEADLAAVVEVGDVVADDVFVEDRDVSTGGLDVEVAK